MEEKTPITPVVEATSVENNANAQTPTFNRIIKEILANGGTKLAPCKIKNVNTDEMDNYQRVSFTLTSPIPAYVRMDDGSYKEGVRNVIFTSTYAIAGTIRENEDMAWMGNELIKRPEALNLILNGAEIKIIQQRISAGTPYVNPFTTKEEPDPTTFDHDVIISHIIDFKLSKTGQKMADTLSVKLLGF